VALAIRGRLVFGSYDAAASDDTAAYEWPPHPARVFSALVAGAVTAEHWAALEWLEQQSPPEVWAGDEVLASVARSTFAVTNQIAGRKQGNLFLPGRTNVLRVKPTVNPAEPSFAIVWVNATVPRNYIDAFKDLATRVPYLGRSTSTVELRFDAAVPELESAWVVLAPERVEGGGVPLRVPYLGFVAALRDAYERGARAWEVCRSVWYAPRVTAPEEDFDAGEPGSVYSDFVVFGFPRGVRVEGIMLAQVTDALRRAVLALVPDPVPASVEGHEANSTTHAAFLAVPDVGHRHADGHLLGVAVALPTLAAEERRRVLAALLPGAGRSGLRELAIREIGRLSLVYDPTRTQPRGIVPERWQGPARTWCSATPMVLDRFPARRGQLTEEIVRSCSNAGLHEPITVDYGSNAFIRGGVQLRAHQIPRREPSRRPFTHVRVTFPIPVRGPIAIGAGRYLGLGLLAPDSS
jgi:CRISPR-associated protein Csb2